MSIDSNRQVTLSELRLRAVSTSFSDPRFLFLQKARINHNEIKIKRFMNGCFHNGSKFRFFASSDNPKFQASSLDFG